MTSTDPASSIDEALPGAATGEKAKRQITETTRRIIFLILGVFVLIISVAGFYFTSDAFDEHTPVMVAATDINKGDTVTASYFTSTQAVMGSISHIPFTPGADLAFDGWVAIQPIPAGTVVLDTMMIPPETQPVGSQLELAVPLTTIDPTGLNDPDAQVFEGDTVLLIDRGIEPSTADPGLPPKVLDLLTLRNFDSATGTMTLFLEPEEWNVWQTRLEALGFSLPILPVPLGSSPEEAAEFAQKIDAVLLARWNVKVAAIQAALAPTGPQPGPGELEVIVTFDTSLAPSGVVDGDEVLMIDPGQLPLGEVIGRARKVLQTIELENFDGTAMRLFVPPEEWLTWQSLPERLGASPMVLPVPDGTDIDDMTERLNREWNEEWELAINNLGKQPGSP